MNLDFERKEEINYSIIIPHKNSTVLLERCLKSIPCRKDVQVIVVDDNSENQEELNAVVGGFSQVELILTQAERSKAAETTYVSQCCQSCLYCRRSKSL